MRNYEQEYQSLMQQIRVKSAYWRSHQPSVRDFYQTLDSWKAELQRLELVGEDARVKAALEAVDKLPVDRRDAIKSVPNILEALSAPKADDGWQSAGKRATMKALNFDTKARGVKP